MSPDPKKRQFAACRFIGNPLGTPKMVFGPSDCRQSYYSMQVGRIRPMGGEPFRLHIFYACAGMISTIKKYLSQDCKRRGRRAAQYPHISGANRGFLAMLRAATVGTCSNSLTSFAQTVSQVHQSFRSQHRETQPICAKSIMRVLRRPPPPSLAIRVDSRCCAWSILRGTGA
jgi:hypothetical protein